MEVLTMDRLVYIYYIKFPPKLWKIQYIILLDT